MAGPESLPWGPFHEQFFHRNSNAVSQHSLLRMNADLLFTRALATNNWNLNEISFKKMHLTISSVKWRLFYSEISALGNLVHGAQAEYPMEPSGNFTWGPNGPHKIGEFVMHFYGGTLSICLGPLEIHMVKAPAIWKKCLLVPRALGISGLSHWGLVMPYSVRDLGQYWFRLCLVAWWHQAITWIDVDWSSIRLRRYEERN